MTERTHIDEIVRFPDLVLLELSKNPLFVSLLTNIPDASLDDQGHRGKMEHLHQQLYRRRRNHYRHHVLLLCGHSYQNGRDRSRQRIYRYPCRSSQRRDVSQGHRVHWSLRQSPGQSHPGNRLHPEGQPRLRHRVVLSRTDISTGKDSQLSAVRVQSNPLQGRDLRTIEEYKPWKNKRVLTAFSRASR